MVFFNCNACGEALKKNQVEKHKYRCRNCQSLSCVDCGKDFWGSEFNTHTKCITENEKYCGKGYVAKVNKGEVKQEQWIEKVQLAIEKASSDGKLRGLLQQLQDYPNIPRKKAKFENFLKNSLRVLSPFLISQVWDLLMESTINEQKAINATESKENGSTNSTQSKTDNTNTDSMISNGVTNNQTNEDEQENKLSKREKKEERQKKNKKEKKDKQTSESTDNDENIKKKKKRKHDESDEESNISEDPVKGKKRKLEEEAVSERKVSKKKKKNDNNLLGHLENGNGDLQQIENVLPEPDDESSEKKFKWDTAITDVLEKKGEISMKKLRRKVIQAFLSDNPTSHDQETAGIKFNKKLRKLPQVIVEKERVRLK